MERFTKSSQHDNRDFDRGCRLLPLAFALLLAAYAAWEVLL